MVLFPNCKINLGLNIISKREDGYHNLETVFYPLNITDALEIIPNQTSDPAIEFSASGIQINGATENNLCVKACLLLKKDFPGLPPVQIHLHKGVPAGAGLGAGSADAAFTLKLLNDKFDLKLTTSQLIAYAAQVGSDCAFFIINKTCYATGKGEQLEPFELDLSAYKFVIVNPGIHISTGQAFLSARPSEHEGTIKEIVRSPVEKWKNELSNDFEQVIFKQYPSIAAVKDDLYAAGAIYASMTGSGSSVYGIFSKEKEPSLSFPPGWFVKELHG